MPGHPQLSRDGMEEAEGPRAGGSSQDEEAQQDIFH